MKLHEKLDDLLAMKEQVEELQERVDDLYNVETEGTVPKTDLDAAYKEGVNSVE